MFKYVFISSCSEVGHVQSVLLLPCSTLNGFNPVQFFKHAFCNVTKGEKVKVVDY